ncbi:MAG: hypothetical protein JWQ96_3322 [Segetibacter sp.]|nr:hypothetical protein [Segetibacter sp.]
MLTFQIATAESRDIQFKKYAWLIYAAWLLFGLLNLVLGNNKNIEYGIVLPGILLLSSLFSLYSYKKQPKSYLIIDNLRITWFLPYFTRKEEVLWDDIKWIKTDSEEMTFCRESSFTKRFPFNALADRDVKTVKQIIEEKAFDKKTPINQEVPKKTAVLS